MQDDQQVTEDALRQALARLGSGQSRNSRRSPGSGGHSQERRRRFVNDGQVVVEHQGGTRMGALRSSNEDQEEIGRLKQAVRREQRRWEEAERGLSEARGQIRALETHIAHARIQISELSDQLREQKDLVQSLKGRLHQSVPAASVKRASRPVGRPRKEMDVPRKSELSEEPEPVQWWIKTS